MTTDFRDWYVGTPPAGDASNRIANTLFVSQATFAISQLATVAGLTILANLSSGVSSVAATTISNVFDQTIGSAQGQVLYRNAASWVFLPAGSTGQLLKTGGGGNNPSWAGGLVLLNTLSPSGVASTNDTSSLTSIYRNYLITFENICPATNTTTFQMRIATTSSAFTTAGYVSMANVMCSAILATDNSTAAILLSGARATTQNTTSAVYGLNGFVYVSNPASALIRKMFTGQTTFQTPGTVGTTTQAMANISGFNDVANAVTGVNFLFDSGNIATGTIKIYGIS